MSGLSWVDYGILMVYLAGVTAAGILWGRGQRNSQDFFLAGRTMWWLPMALSVIATDFSAISFLGVPGYVAGYDLVLYLQPIALFWVLPLALFLFVRFFHSLELISAYEYLEKRFNLPSRLICSVLFICWRLSWMGTAIYATSLAATQLTGLPFWSCALIIGCLTTFYSALGGMKAVIYTDVTQFFVFIAAIIAVLIQAVGSVPGGFSTILSIANEAGRTRLVNFEGGWQAITTPAVLIGGSFIILSSYGVDQVIIQRYLTAKSLGEIKRGLITQLCIAPLMIWTLAIVGLAVFSYYTHFSIKLPVGLKPDLWFPHYIVHELPIGVSGLVVAGIFAATMSSVSSGVNSLTAVCVVDFFRRYCDRPTLVRSEATNPGLEKDRIEVLLSKVLTAVWGLLATALAFIVGKIGVIHIAAQTLQGFFTGVLLGVFLLGILSPRANGLGALFGGLIGFFTIATIGAGTSINLFWYAPIGCVSTVVSGFLASLLFPAPPFEKISNLTLKSQSGGFT